MMCCSNSNGQRCLFAARGAASWGIPHPTHLHVPLQLLQQRHVFIQAQEGFAEARGQDEDARVGRPLALHELLQLIAINRDDNNKKEGSPRPRAVFCCLPRSPDGRGSAPSCAFLKAARPPRRSPPCHREVGRAGRELPASIQQSKTPLLWDAAEDAVWWRGLVCTASGVYQCRQPVPRHRARHLVATGGCRGCCPAAGYPSNPPGPSWVL